MALPNGRCTLVASQVSWLEPFMFCMTFVLFTRPVIEHVGTVVDKRKSVVKLLSMACPRVP